ncbi:MAG: hypothetical protein HY721_23665 [Planctomycetes bacterium]|nr:hypothetical protein [Planctomycetota bacterium]
MRHGSRSAGGRWGRLVALALVVSGGTWGSGSALGRPVATHGLKVGSASVTGQGREALVPITLDSVSGLVQELGLAVACDPRVLRAVAIEPSAEVLALGPVSVQPWVQPEQGLAALTVVIDRAPPPRGRGIEPGKAVPVAWLRLARVSELDPRSFVESAVRWTDAGGQGPYLVVSGQLKAAEALDLRDGLVSLAPTPDPAFHASPLRGQAPLTVELRPELELVDPDLPWCVRWDFGDGATEAAPGRAVHVYREPGVYTASLTVATAEGAVAAQVEVTVEAGPVPAATFRRGAVNADGSVDISDAIAILFYLFLGGAEPACLDAADVNDDGAVDISDAVRLLGYLFAGLPAPPPPGPAVAGPDPTPDELGCGGAGKGPGAGPYPPLERFSQAYASPGGCEMPLVATGARTLLRPGAGDPSTAFPGAGSCLGLALEGSSTPIDDQDGAPFADARVDLATCSLVYSREVLRIRGRGFDWAHRIVYRSDSRADTPQGQGWSHGYFTYFTPLPGGDVHLSLGDQHRGEVFRANGDGTFAPPPGLFARLVAVPDGHVLVDRAGKVRRFDAIGRLAEVRDANGNSLRLFYEDAARPYLLTRVNDTLGRDIRYSYSPAAGPVEALRSRLLEVTDFTGRTVRFEYGAGGDLVAVRSPVVTGTPHGNDFPEGKVHRYRYGAAAGPPALRHNLVAVIRPNENEPGPFGGSAPEGTPALTFEYDAADRLTAYGAGYGTVRISCEEVPLEPATATRNACWRRALVTDRVGHATLYCLNSLGAITARSELTSGIHETDPPAFVTEWKLDERNLLERLTLPAGNAVAIEYDVANPDPLGRADVLAVTRLPDRARGGDQESHRWLFVHEPLFHRPVAVVDPRGTDPAYVPPNGGAASPARYAERLSYDHQEGAGAAELAAKVFIDPPALAALADRAAARLASLGLPAAVLGLGDLNSDGVVAGAACGGNLVRRAPPAVLLTAKQARQAAVEGGPVQAIVHELRYNAFGQLAADVDPEGNTDLYVYYAAADPNGDGDGSEVTRPGASAVTGGYLAAVLRDAAFPPVLSESLAGLEVQPGPASPRRREAAAPVEALRRYERDSRGNVLRETDPRGNSVERTFNALDQVVATTGPAPFLYVEELFYSANDTLIQENQEDKVVVAPGGRPDIPLGLVAVAVNEADPDASLSFTSARTTVANAALGAPGRVLPGFFRSTTDHDILDQPTLSRQDAVGSPVPVLEVRFGYDRNGNLMQVGLPKGNVHSARYDERDLIYQVAIGSLGAAAPPIPGSTSYGNDAFLLDAETSVFTQWYDRNGNAVVLRDAQDNDRDGFPEETRFVFDGFDREVAAIDAAGNVALTRHDPLSLPVQALRFGSTGGPTPGRPDYGSVETEVRSLTCPGVPTSSSTRVGGFPALASVRTHRDELGRAYQTDRALFLAPAPPGVQRRAPPSVEGPFLKDGAINAQREYDRSSRLTFLTGDHGEVTSLQHDGLDRRIGLEDPSGNRTRFAFDSAGNRIATVSTDLAGEGRTRGAAGAGGGAPLEPEVFVRTNEYDALGRLTRTADNVGNAYILAYDSRGNVTNRVDPEGSSQRTLFDGASRPIAEVRDLRDAGDALTGEGTRAPIVLERLGELGIAPHQAIDDTGISMQWTWTPNGRIDRRTDDNGNATQLVYDSHDRLVEERNRDGRSTTLTYDRDDHLTFASDRNANGYKFGYDPIQRVLTYTSGRAFSVPADNLNANPLLPSPSETRTATIQAVGTAVVQYEYDGLGRVTYAFDGNDPDSFADNSVVRRDHDSLSRLVQEDQSFGPADAAVTRSVLWAHEGASRVTRVVYPNGRELSLAYDALGRIDSIADAPAAGGRLIASYERVGPARLLRRLHGNGTAVDLSDGAGTSYDAAGRPLRVRHTGVSGVATGAFGFEHGYEAGGDPRFERKLHAPGLGDLYETDSDHRLVQLLRGTLAAVTHAGGVVRAGSPRPTGQDFAGPPAMAAPPSIGLGIEERSLDGLGNWQEVRLANQTFDLSVGITDVIRANDQNEVASTGEAGSSLGVAKTLVLHDPSGNRIEDGTFGFRYDTRNRLREVRRRSDGALVARYLYDAYDRRIRKEVLSSGPHDGVTHFYYDGDRAIEERDGAGSLLRQHVFGQRMDEPLVLDRNLDGDATATGAADERLFFHQDLRRSVCGLSDMTGRLVEGHVYDPYGQVTTFSPGANGVLDFGGDDGGVRAPGARGNRCLFTAQYLDAETGLYYFRARHYDPVLGRFLSRDIQADGASVNLYEYAASNPFANLDPTGHIAATVFEEYGVREVWDMEIGGEEGPFWAVTSLLWPGEYGNEAPAFTYSVTQAPPGVYHLYSEVTYLPILIQYVEKYPAPETVHHEWHHVRIWEDVATNVLPSAQVMGPLASDPTLDSNPWPEYTASWSTLVTLGAPLQDAFHAGHAKRDRLKTKWIARDFLNVLRYGWRDPKWAAIRMGAIIYRVAQKVWKSIKKAFGLEARLGPAAAGLAVLLLLALRHRRRGGSAARSAALTAPRSRARPPPA